MAKQTIDLVELYRQEPLEACRLALERTRDIETMKRFTVCWTLWGVKHKAFVPATSSFYAAYQIAAYVKPPKGTNLKVREVNE